jgi:chemotaxis signal transduction protein
VLILERGDHAFGLLVGEVKRVVTVDEQLGEPPRGQEHAYIAGVFSTGGGPLLLIDVDALDEGLGS